MTEEAESHRQIDDDVQDSMTILDEIQRVQEDEGEEVTQQDESDDVVVQEVVQEDEKVVPETCECCEEIQVRDDVASEDDEDEERCEICQLDKPHARDHYMGGNKIIDRLLKIDLNMQKRFNITNQATNTIVLMECLHILGIETQLKVGYTKTGNDIHVLTWLEVEDEMIDNTLEEDASMLPEATRILKITKCYIDELPLEYVDDENIIFHVPHNITIDEFLLFAFVPIAYKDKFIMPNDNEKRYLLRMLNETRKISRIRVR